MSAEEPASTGLARAIVRFDQQIKACQAAGEVEAAQIMMARREEIAAWRYKLQRSLWTNSHRSTGGNHVGTDG